MDQPHLLCLIPGLLSGNLLFCLHLLGWGGGYIVSPCSGNRVRREETREGKCFQMSHWVRGIVGGRYRTGDIEVSEEEGGEAGNGGGPEEP